MSDEIDELCIRIDRAWTDERDRFLVERIIREHPQYEDDLMEFFEALLLEELGDEAPVSIFLDRISIDEILEKISSATPS